MVATIFVRRIMRSIVACPSCLADANAGKRHFRRSRPTTFARLAAVVLSALLSAVHVLALALGLGAVFQRGRALAGPLDDAGWRRLLAADDAWAGAAFLWIASGLARVFFGGREPGFYWYNGFFWVKMALFGAVFLLELTPMIALIRVRSARRRHATLPLFPIESIRRINRLELMLVVVIVFVAAFMARGAWLFA